MIPPEAAGKLLLLVQASDEDGTWSAGLLRASTGNLRAGRESQIRAELLLAQLQDARAGEAAAAALAERSRIAGELHDVLAHSLSGLAIQLQGTRKLADREGVSTGLRATIERSAELTKAGTGGRPASRQCPARRTAAPPWISWVPSSRVSAATSAQTPRCGSTGRAGHCRPRPASDLRP